MIRMQIQGGEQLARTLEQVATRASKPMLRNALRAVAAVPIQERAAQGAARAPGAPDIATHIAISTAATRGSASAAALWVGPSTEARSDQASRSFDVQGLYLEYGTNDTAAQPFMRPAFDSEAPRAIGRFAGEVWSALIRGGFAGARGISGGGGGLL
jgi:HK97 gp10 family phage protein